MAELKTKILLLNGTQGEWADLSQYVLSRGEPAVEFIPNIGSDSTTLTSIKVKIGDGFTSFLFGGREYLEVTPMSLSHVRGFIAAGEYEEAALLIQELYAQFPESPELNALIFEFYCDCCKNRPLAREFAGNYLKSIKFSSPENIVILLRYCDLCRENGIDNDEIIDFLLDQSTKKVYSEPDKKRIYERVKGLSA
jgi:hypothetical protein